MAPVPFATVTESNDETVRWRLSTVSARYAASAIAFSNVLTAERALHWLHVEVCSSVYRVAVPDFLAIVIKVAQPSFITSRACGNTERCPFAAAESWLRSRHVAMYSPSGSASFSHCCYPRIVVYPRWSSTSLAQRSQSIRVLQMLLTLQVVLVFRDADRIESGARAERTGSTSGDLHLARTVTPQTFQLSVRTIVYYPASYGVTILRALCSGLRCQLAFGSSENLFWCQCVFANDRLNLRDRQSNFLLLCCLDLLLQFFSLLQQFTVTCHLVLQFSYSS